jgi:hypothetical protein
MFSTIIGFLPGTNTQHEYLPLQKAYFHALAILPFLSEDQITKLKEHVIIEGFYHELIN